MTNPLNLAAGYLCIGVLVLVARVLLDCCITWLKTARELSEKHSVSVLRSATALLLCGVVLVASLIVTWPILLTRLVREWWRK